MIRQGMNSASAPWALGTNVRFFQTRRDGFRVFCQRSGEAEEALSALLPDPDRIFEKGKIFKPGTRTHVGTVVLGEKTYFLKRYNFRGRFYSVKNALRRSRAVRTWILAWEFLDRGVPVPIPLLCLEERYFRLMGRSYVLMESASGASLRKAWPGLEGPRKEELLSRIGRILGRMHGLGCIHGDLKWDNILIGEEESREGVRLIDLDGGRLMRKPRLGSAKKDLERFLQEVRKAEAGPEWEQRLKNAWLDGWSAGLHENRSI